MQSFLKEKNSSQDALVSMVIPVYNVEKYVEECIQSAINQSYQNTEIILVDDGSTDSSGLICDQYLDVDSRIRVVHKKNGGLSDARNAGVDIAKGDYITFVDSDDVIANEYVEYMIRLAEKYNADIVQVGYTKDIEKLGEKNENRKPKLYSGDEAIRNLFRMQDVKETACVKLYKKSIVEKVSFPVARLYEDVLTAYKFVFRTQNYICDNGALLYYYRPNNAGIMHRKLSKTRFSVLSVGEESKQFLGDSFERLRIDWSYYCMRHMINVYNECIAEKGDKEFASTLKTLRKQLLANRKEEQWKDIKYTALLRLLWASAWLYKIAILVLRKNWK